MQQPNIDQRSMAEQLKIFWWYYGSNPILWTGNKKAQTEVWTFCCPSLVSSFDYSNGTLQKKECRLYGKKEKAGKQHNHSAVCR